MDSQVSLQRGRGRGGRRPTPHTRLGRSLPAVAVITHCGPAAKRGLGSHHPPSGQRGPLGGGQTLPLPESVGRNREIIGHFAPPAVPAHPDLDKPHDISSSPCSTSFFVMTLIIGQVRCRVLLDLGAGHSSSFLGTAAAHEKPFHFWGGLDDNKPILKFHENKMICLFIS